MHLGVAQRARRQARTRLDLRAMRQCPRSSVGSRVDKADDGRAYLRELDALVHRGGVVEAQRARAHGGTVRLRGARAASVVARAFLVRDLP